MYINKRKLRACKSVDMIDTILEHPETYSEPNRLQNLRDSLHGNTLPSNSYHTNNSGIDIRIESNELEQDANSKSPLKDCTAEQTIHKYILNRSTRTDIQGLDNRSTQTHVKSDDIHQSYNKRTVSSIYLQNEHGTSPKQPTSSTSSAIYVDNKPVESSTSQINVLIKMSEDDITVYPANKQRAENWFHFGINNVEDKRDKIFEVCL